MGSMLRNILAGLVISFGLTMFSGAALALPPTLTFTAPAENSLLNTALPRFELSYGPLGALIDPASLSLIDNTRPLVVSCTTYSMNNGASCLPTVALAQGLHIVTGTIKNSLGMSSVQARVRLTIDTLPPVIILSAPTAGLRTNKTVQIVSGRLSEPGSLTINGNPVTLGTNNSFSYNINLQAGNNSIPLIAKDLLGNTIQLNVIVIRDNVAPSITLTSPVNNLLAQQAQQNFIGNLSETAKLTVNGQLVTVAANLQFNHGPVPLNGGTNNFILVATDLAGNSSQLTVSVIFNSFSVTILSPVANAIINSNQTTVSGTFLAPTNSGITVNGVAAELSGNRFFASGVDLLAGSNTLTITATTADGRSLTQTRTVTASGRLPTFAISAEPDSGLAPLESTFTIINNGSTTIRTISADLDGNSSIDFSSSDPAVEIKFRYSVAGVYLAVINVTDSTGAVYRLAQVVVVSALVARDQMLRGIYTGMLSKLTARNITGALQAVTISLHDKYQAVFTTLQPSLPAVVSQLGTLQDGSIGNEFAEYTIVRNTPSGPQAFLIYFIRGEDGVWRIDGM